MENKKTSKEFAVVFGLGPAGLFLTRQLHRAGYVVFGIGKDDDVGRYSNCLECYYAEEAIDNIKEIVCGLHKEYLNTKAFVCSDQYLNLFLEQWPEVFSILDFADIDIDLLRLFFKKDVLVKYCSEINIPFPVEYRTLDDEKEIQFPVAIKLNIKRGHSKFPKVSVIENNGELCDFFDKAKHDGFTQKDFIVQQYIAGNNSFELGYGGYFRNGVAIVDVAFSQLRQYPQGVSCLTCELSNEDTEVVKKLVKPFIEKTKYNGFLQFDIKKDCNTGNLYVLDINPRPWGSVSMLTPKCGNHSIFDDTFQPRNVKVCWRFPLKEIISLKNANNTPYKEICKKGFIQVIDLYDRHDKKPFFMQLIIIVKKIMK